MFICKFCNREFSKKRGLVYHENRCKQNPNKIEQTSWNKGLTKETSDSVRKGAEKTSVSMRKNEKITGRASTPEKELERIKKIKETAKIGRKMGGIRIGSGRGKKGWYKGFYSRSSWELAWIIYNIEHHIQFKQCKEFFYYTYKEEQHKYYPDFIIDDVYYEIKGRRRDNYGEQVNCKIRDFPKKLITIDNIEIKKYLNYAIEKYGQDFCEKLYE